MKRHRKDHARRLARWVATGLVVLCVGCSSTGDVTVPLGTVTQGPGTVTASNLFKCPAAPDARVSAVGKVVAADGTAWTTPADVAWSSTPRLDDLYNDCAGVRPAGIQNVDLNTVPIHEIDPGGEVITGYLFGDNYFELYVNGVLVGVDPVPYTPFNSTVVRFRVNRPFTYAVKLVDWEENLGLGTEKLGDDPHHAGDGGFIASFSDGTVTDASWKAQTFYIAPLNSPGDVTEKGNVHDTSALDGSGSQPAGACADRCYALHYPVPNDWASPTFNDADWPAATEYTESKVGVDFPAYQNFRPQLTAGGAKFVWTSNLVRDNVVLARKVSR